jgi:hypothetical protein
MLGPFLKDIGKFYLATSEADARNRNDASGLRQQVMGNPECAQLGGRRLCRRSLQVDVNGAEAGWRAGP